MKFDISKFAEGFEKVSESDTPQLIRIPLADIVPDERNFYRINGVDELAASIELVGLQEPLVVRRDGAKYRVVSGHRRRAALQQLVERGKTQFETVPCMEETDEISAEEQEVRLILGNATSRQLTPLEISQQSDRLDRLFRRMEEQGQRIDGRKRDIKARLLGVPATKLAELDVIRDKLQEPFAGQFARSELTQSAAYNIARLPVDVQGDLNLALGNRGKPVEGTAAGRLVRNYAQIYQQATAPCPTGGSVCGNLRGFLRGAARPNASWRSCEGGCCCKCQHRESCPGVCAAAKKQNEKDRFDRQRASQLELAAKEQKKRENMASNRDHAKRLLRAAEAAGLQNDATLHLDCRNVSVAELRWWCAGNFGSFPITSEDNVTPWSRERLRDLAKKLQCSTDYILGLTEELHPAPTPEEGQLHLMAWMPGGTTPAHSCTVVMEFDLGSPTLERRLGFFSAPDGVFKINSDKIERQPTRWVELPE